MKKAIEGVVSNFIKEYIICCYGIPHKIISDNGTYFVNKEVSKALKDYGIKHRRSSLYYPQGNGQAEATNKTLVRIISKMVHEYEKG